MLHILIWTPNYNNNNNPIKNLVYDQMRMIKAVYDPFKENI